MYIQFYLCEIGTGKVRTSDSTLVKLCDCDTGPSNSKRLKITDNEPRQPEVTSPPKFTVLLRELSGKVSADWEYIGLSLEIEQGDLSAIKRDHQESKTCFREVLRLWLKQVDPPPTWSAMVEALEVLDHKPLAKNLKMKYCI